VLLFLAGFPPELIDAAKINGADAVQRFVSSRTLKQPLHVVIARAVRSTRRGSGARRQRRSA
jgi:hypothetical protein